MMNHPIYTCFWYDGNANEAARFYCSIFENSKIISENPIMVVFDINGYRIMGLNGGPRYKFNESISLVVSCDTQQEIDYYWDALSKDGVENMCGWLKDKYGLSWQIVPTLLGKWMSNPAYGAKITEAFLKMKTFHLTALEKIASTGSHLITKKYLE